MIRQFSGGALQPFRPLPRVTDSRDLMVHRARCSIEAAMSEMGHLRRFSHVFGMSAYTPIATG
jgi:hypothetical protein